MLARRRIKRLSLIGVVSLVMLFAQATASMAAISMLPCTMGGMAGLRADAPMTGAVAPAMCVAACTIQDRLCSQQTGAHDSPAAAPAFATIVADPVRQSRTPWQAATQHAGAPPLRILYCRLRD
jgi:hypothetical protein